MNYNPINFLTLAFIVLAFGWSNPSQAQVELKFEPEILMMSIGESARVGIRVDGIASPGLAAYQIRLSTDPVLISVADPNAGFTDQVEPFSPLGADPLCTTVRGIGICEDPNWILIASGRSAVTAVATEDNASGNTVIMTGSTGAEEPVTGSGIIAYIEITALTTGSVTVDVDQSILASGAAAPSEIIHTRSNLMVNVGAIIDSDGDGIADSMDNCQQASNLSQLDIDGDGIGNACDPDINNDCAVNFPDYFIYSENFLVTGALPTDNNGDNVTNFGDIAVFASFFLGVPGPSGIPNICSAAKPAGQE